MNALLMAAAIPPLYLFFKIYKMDSVEKEPAGLLVRLMIGGGIITFAAAFIEDLFSFLYSDPDLSYWTAQFIENFIVVALTEEACKYFVLRHLTWRHPAFNYTFDGIVYAVSVSLGFALVENVMYVFSYGMQVALIRAFTAIVGHAVFGVIMGSYYGQARREAYAGRDRAARFLRRLGILMAVLLHGAYDFTASQDSDLFTAVFLIIVVGMYIVTYKKVKRAQENDTATYVTLDGPDEFNR